MCIRDRVSSVDKANVLETSRLWRSVMHRLAEEYPDVQYEDCLLYTSGVLYEFPVKELDLFLPPWVDALPYDHPIKLSLIHI